MGQAGSIITATRQGMSRPPERPKMNLPRNLTKQQVENILSILEKADNYAEQYGERRDVVRVQKKIEEIRQRLKELNE
jgi:hypothetical protein